MAIQQIVKIPNQILTTPCEKVKTFDEEIKKIAQDLKDTLESAKNPEGAGLAAPQIGVLKRVLVAKRFFKDPVQKNKTTSEMHVLVNPKLINASKETDIDFEGCLSIPDTYGKVERSTKIKVKAFDTDGNELIYTATGLFARIILHEMDHLDGVLFTTKVIGNTMTDKELDDYIEKELRNKKQ